MTQPIRTTKTRMIDGELYRRLSETVFYTSKEIADEKAKEMEANKYRGRSYKARSFKMSYTKYIDGEDEPEITVQYFIYVKAMEMI